MYHKDAVLHPRKLDWMLLHRRTDLVKVMRDNGSFLSFPKMGSRQNIVTVYAESRVNAERTLRSLHFLVKKYHLYIHIYTHKKKRANLNYHFFYFRPVVSMKLASILIIVMVLFMVLKVLILFSTQSQTYLHLSLNYLKYLVLK